MDGLEKDCDNTVSPTETQKLGKHSKFTDFNYSAADAEQQIQMVPLNTVHHPHQKPLSVKAKTSSDQRE